MTRGGRGVRTRFSGLQDHLCPAQSCPGVPHQALHHWAHLALDSEWPEWIGLLNFFSSFFVNSTLIQIHEGPSPSAGTGVAPGCCTANPSTRQRLGRGASVLGTSKVAPRAPSRPPHPEHPTDHPKSCPDRGTKLVRNSVGAEFSPR